MKSSSLWGSTARSDNGSAMPSTMSPSPTGASTVTMSRFVPTRRSSPQLLRPQPAVYAAAWDDMLVWARNWLQPYAAQLAWLSETQQRAMWTPRTPMPISERRRDWSDTHYYAYAFGFRLADVDGVWTVSHTGTLMGMYSVMTLLPDTRSGFVLLTGTVMRVGERYLVDWDDDSVDVEAWLDFFGNSDASATLLTMSKVDPQGDFSFDYEDLAFTRERDCE